MSDMPIIRSNVVAAVSNALRQGDTRVNGRVPVNVTSWNDGITVDYRDPDQTVTIIITVTAVKS